MSYILAIDNDLTLVRPVECGQEIEERGLPRSGGTGKDDELARVDLERIFKRAGTDSCPRRYAFDTALTSIRERLFIVRLS